MLYKFINIWQINTIEDPEFSDTLYDAIHGSGAFRLFKYHIHRYGIQDKWYDFRDKAVKQIAINWYKNNNIEYIDTLF